MCGWGTGTRTRGAERPLGPCASWPSLNCTMQRRQARANRLGGMGGTSNFTRRGQSTQAELPEREPSTCAELHLFAIAQRRDPIMRAPIDTLMGSQQGLLMLLSSPQLLQSCLKKVCPPRSYLEMANICYQFRVSRDAVQVYVSTAITTRISIE
jgi:hypothetical protein